MCERTTLWVLTNIQILVYVWVEALHAKLCWWMSLQQLQHKDVSSSPPSTNHISLWVFISKQPCSWPCSMHSSNASSKLVMSTSFPPHTRSPFDAMEFILHTQHEAGVCSPDVPTSCQETSASAGLQSKLPPYLPARQYVDSVSELDCITTLMCILSRVVSTVKEIKASLF